MIYPKFTLQIAKMIISGKCITLIYWVFKKVFGGSEADGKFWHVVPERQTTAMASPPPVYPSSLLQYISVSFSDTMWAAKDNSQWAISIYVMDY